MLFAMLSVGFSLTLCDPVYGKLVNTDGTAVANVKVTREWHWRWNDTRGSDETFTDENGIFNFGHIKNRAIFAHILPHQPGITFSLFTYDTKEKPKLFFEATKKSYADNEGMEAIYPMKLHCNIDGDINESTGFYYGNCVQDK